jgi:hypothetical protein
MNPLMKENQILRMISESTRILDEENNLFWIDFKYPIKKTVCLPIPYRKSLLKQKETGGIVFEASDNEKIAEQAMQMMFDLSMHHYISNVKRYGSTLEVRFKECRGGRMPNFGVRTVKKISKIIEKGSIPTYPF